MATKEKTELAKTGCSRYVLETGKRGASIKATIYRYDTQTESGQLAGFEFWSPFDPGTTITVMQVPCARVTQKRTIEVHMAALLKAKDIVAEILAKPASQPESVPS